MVLYYIWGIFSNSFESFEGFSCRAIASLTVLVGKSSNFLFLRSNFVEFLLIFLKFSHFLSHFGPPSMLWLGHCNLLREKLGLFYLVVQQATLPACVLRWVQADFKLGNKYQKYQNRPWNIDILKIDFFYIDTMKVVGLFQMNFASPLPWKALLEFGW